MELSWVFIALKPALTSRTHRDSTLPPIPCHSPPLPEPESDSRDELWFHRGRLASSRHGRSQVAGWWTCGTSLVSVETNLLASQWTSEPTMTLGFSRDHHRPWQPISSQLGGIVGSRRSSARHVRPGRTVRRTDFRMFPYPFGRVRKPKKWFSPFTDHVICTRNDIPRENDEMSENCN